MKKSTVLTFAVLLVAVTLCNVHAAARSVSNEGRDYVIGAPALNAWSCGVYADSAKRFLEVLDMPVKLESSRIMVYAGYDVLPWLTPYLTVGQGSYKFGGAGGEKDNKVGYGLGLQLNFLDHEVPDPTLMEDRLRLNANIEYTWQGAEWMGEEADWQELDASLTVSIVNDLSGNVLFIPDSIALFCGPIYSSLSGDVDGEDSSDWGFCAGMEVFYTKRVSLNAQYNKLSESGYSAGLNIHF